MSRDRTHSSPPARCPMEADCPIYAMFKLAGMTGMWQALYCHGAFQRCERYQAACAGRRVPAHMLPDGKLLQLSKRPPKE